MLKTINSFYLLNSLKLNMIVLGLLSIFLFSSNLIHQRATGSQLPKIQEEEAQYIYDQDGITRGDRTKKELSIVFTGGDYGDGGKHIAGVLKKMKVQGSFFFTGDFYRNPEFGDIIGRLVKDKHYLGAHSDQHLLYCDWNNRDSLLVSKSEFLEDLEANYHEMEKFGISAGDAKLFMPPYEWYNKTISQWTKEAGFQLINFTPGTRTNADYTTPGMSSYQSSDDIWESIVEYEASSSVGLNGYIMLIHIGAAPERTDKFYLRLEKLIMWLKSKGYDLKRIDELISIE